ncbi:hypothetical protein [Actinopolymorpha pittospori]|uniref:Uncharacterized protein n=1 Tax=Actinopolymorpha pittospori TaxID=648752 RepID=A0A927RAY2_9ACTN|nr:hypothetical protein [Actinopolymorpha pittospori]MBE1608164.1 hypothetical protein [Actinopolymorpha pittospori]
MIGSFLALEIPAIRNKVVGDTLSERLRAWLGLNPWRKWGVAGAWSFGGFIVWFHFHILTGEVSSSENDHSSGTYKVVARMSRAMTRIETDLIVKIWNSRHGAMSPSGGYEVSADNDRFTLEGATTAEVPAHLSEALNLVVDEVN